MDVNNSSNPSTESSCSPEASVADYSLSWHIAGLFIVLVVSAVGMFTSLLLGSYGEKSMILQKALQLAKMFGIGIIAGTAWIHLLPDAFENFSNPCIDPWWQSYGTAWVGVFGLVAAFGVQLIEMAGHSHVKKSVPTGRHNRQVRRNEEHNVPNTEFSIQEDTYNATNAAVGVVQSLRFKHSPGDSSDPTGVQQLTSKDAGPQTHSTQVQKGMYESNCPHIHLIEIGFRNNSSSTLTIVDPYGDALREKQSQSIKRVSALVLEAGIISHSLIIGFALGVTPDESFTTLLFALCFHQLFEGVALGVLVSDSNLRTTSKVIMGTLYPLSTPIGIALGISFRSSYNESSSSLLLTQGIFGSLSAGILIYNTYCELVGGEINHNPSFDQFDSSFKILCFLAMYVGAAAMAIIGYWA
jgi:ZIP zinc/iron transport family